MISANALKMVAHVVLFIAALLVFWTGLFIGLQANPNMGTILWIVAAVIFLLNLYWLMKTRKRS